MVIGLVIRFEILPIKPQYEQVDGTYDTYISSVI